MKYNWDIEYLEKLERKIKKLKYQHKEKTEELNECLKVLNQLKQYCLEKPIDFPINQKIKYMDKSKFLPRSTYQEYLAIPKDIRKIAYDAIMLCANFENVYNEVSLPKFSCSNEQLIELSLKFSQWLPDKRYEKSFHKILNSKYHLVKFTEVESEESKLQGGIITIDYPRYHPFLWVERNRTIEDFLTQNHEVAHAIFYQTENFQSLRGEAHYLMEVEGSFFEYLSIEYLKGKVKKEILSNLEYLRLKRNYDNVICFYLNLLAVSEVRKEGQISIENIEKRILEDGLSFSVNESLLILSLKESPDSIIKYLISFLTSLELEKIANTDLEYALYLLEKIRCNKQESIIRTLKQNNIYFIEDGCQTIKEKIKEIERNHH